jgi:DNA-binding MarR family transcriptional regulator
VNVFRFAASTHENQSRGLPMTVNTPRQNFARPAPPIVSGQRLYLREDELDAGLSLILQAGHVLKARTRESRDKHGLNWSQARALMCLLRAPQGVLALSAQLGTTKQATIKTIEELTVRGCVTRHDDPRDGRRRTIILTPDGETIARDLGVSMRALLAKAYRKTGGDAVAGCDAVLQAISAGVALPSDLDTKLGGKGS